MYEILVGPVVGTVVGYCTNYIAVKMLFRPLEPKMIFGKRVPFTPGIVPKGKDRLAKALGEMVGGTLFTKEDLENVLLSDEIQQSIKNGVQDFLEKNRENESTIEEFFKGNLEKDKYEENFKLLEKKIVEKIENSLREMNISDIIAEKMIVAVKEKVAGSFLQMMVNDKLLESFRGAIVEKIQEYLETEGKEVIEEKVDVECKKISQTSIGDVVKIIEEKEINLSEMVSKICMDILKKKANKLFEKLDIKQIVEKKIQAMEVLELEKLLMQIMKKELSAVINLGAVIGFILGLVTLFVQ